MSPVPHLYSLRPAEYRSDTGDIQEIWNRVGNFDRAWEGVMSDMQYDPEICRNIAVDIRYVLFVIDKVAGAGHLLNEMEFRAYTSRKAWGML